MFLPIGEGSAGGKAFTNQADRKKLFQYLYQWSIHIALSMSPGRIFTQFALNQKMEAVRSSDLLIESNCNLMVLHK
jgi:hypothetical protein